MLPMHESRLTFLGDLERAIMEVVWVHGKVTVREVVDRLSSSRAPAYTTVMTVMNRLVEKHILQRKPDGQSFRYAAVQSKTQYVASCSRDVVNTFVRCYGDVALAQFIDVLDDVDPKKIAALKQSLRRKS